jgi:hypothetical protein
LPLALLIGAGITASTTYALVKHVQHLLANASVDSSPATWSSAARTQVYDPCYLGCASDCADPKYAWKACQRTVNLPGNCDSNKIWNWADRYPDSCLSAMGDVLRAEALTRLKQSYRNQLAVVILTVLAGVIGGSVTYCLVRNWAKKRDKQAAARTALPPPYCKAVGTRGGGRGRWTRLKVALAASVAALSAPGKVQAYPCTGHDPAAAQFFVGPNGTVGGVARGWWSNCYDETHCFPVCSSSCDGEGRCSQSCWSNCYTTTYTDKAPAHYVWDVARRIKGCGFLLVDGPAGESTAGRVRVANAKIEKDWWVSIAVNGYNVTRPDETDEMVLCLHAIGG